MLCDIDVDQSELPAIGKSETAHVERVGAAMLAQRCRARPISAAAFVRVEIVEGAKWRAEMGK